jgi:hypothetical protein
MGCCEHGSEVWGFRLTTAAWTVFTCWPSDPWEGFCRLVLVRWGTFCPPYDSRFLSYYMSLNYGEVKFCLFVSRKCGYLESSVREFSVLTAYDSRFLSYCMSLNYGEVKFSLFVSRKCEYLESSVREFSVLTAYDVYLLWLLRIVLTAFSLSVMAYRKHMKVMLPRLRYR